MAAIAACLHAVFVDLLHGLDVLRRGWLCRAVGVGVSDHLPWADVGVYRLVVGFAQAGAHRAAAAGDINCRSDIVALWQIQPFGRDGDGNGGGGGHALYCAATAIGHAFVWGVCIGCAGRLGTDRPERHGDLGGGGAGLVHRFVWHPQSGCKGAAPRRGDGHRGGSRGQACGIAGGGNFCGLGLGGRACRYGAAHYGIEDCRVGTAAGAVVWDHLSGRGCGDLPAADVSGSGGGRRRRATSGAGQLGVSAVSVFDEPVHCADCRAGVGAAASGVKPRYVRADAAVGRRSGRACAAGISGRLFQRHVDGDC